MNDRQESGTFVHSLIGKITILGLVFVLVVILFDRVIMPIYTRHGDTIQMVNVVGLDTLEAKTKLFPMHLITVMEDSQYSEKIPAGVVILQRPLPGAGIKEGRRVYLTYSLGKRPLFMPDLTAKGLREAELIIKQLGLKIGTVSYRYSSKLKKGTVSSQSIPPADPISPGQYVDITVSKGESPGKQLVPEIINRPLDHARKLLNMVGLPIDTIIYVPSTSSLPDIVIEQSIPPGTMIKPGDKITLKVTKNR